MMNKTRLSLLLAVLFSAMWQTVLAHDLTELYPHKRAMQSANRYVNKGDMGGAHKEYLAAAAWGHKEAQKLLGLQYLDGQGVDQDFTQAYAWLKLAASMGDSRTSIAFKDMLSNLDEDTISDGEKAFSKLQKKYGDEAALKKRKKWVRKELRNNKSTGARGRASRTTQVQISLSPGRMTNVTMGELQDTLDAYVDEFESKMKNS